MNVKDLIFIVSILLFVSVHLLIGWVVNKINDRRDEVEELREKLKSAEDERDGWKDTAESTHKLLQAEHERADRLAAMNQGLTEDLAALKAYDPEEIEERLKKIREIKAEEEREKSLKNLERLNREVSAQIALSMLNSGYGFPASACCSPAAQGLRSQTLEQMVYAQQYQNARWTL
jgi:tRNA(Ile)-lysidine synthase TilS/MesJ